MLNSHRVTASKPLLAGISAGILAITFATIAAQASGSAPDIRLSAANRVPACAAPENLGAFLRSRNGHLDARFADIARLYREQGEAWRVRWDYAFFQMIVETNALSFRRGNGDPGDVKPRQNNFAGIGTTGGGVPGDSFPDVRTGVMAHIQHLVAYSGERLAQPIAPRTQLKQGDIVEVSLRLRRPVRFSDLARRWAVDRHYWQSIEAVASAFHSAHCTNAADMAPIRETRAAGAVGPKAATADSGVTVAANAGTPRMVRRPALAQRPTQASPRLSGPVRTIWRGNGGRQSPETAPGAPIPSAVVTRSVSAPASGLSMPGHASAASQMPEPSPGAAAREPQTVQPAAVQQAASGELASTPPRNFAFAAGLAMHAGGPMPADGPDTAQSSHRESPSASACIITSASYGGHTVLLIRSEDDGSVRFTALSVLDGFETSMAESYIRAHAPGGRAVGRFTSTADALAQAQDLCRKAQVTQASR